MLLSYQRVIPSEVFPALSYYLTYGGGWVLASLRDVATAEVLDMTVTATLAISPGLKSVLHSLELAVRDKRELILQSNTSDLAWEHRFR